MQRLSGPPLYAKVRSRAAAGRPKAALVGANRFEMHARVGWSPGGAPTRRRWSLGGFCV